MNTPNCRVFCPACGTYDASTMVDETGPLTHYRCDQCSTSFSVNERPCPRCSGRGWYLQGPGQGLRHGVVVCSCDDGKADTVLVIDTMAELIREVHEWAVKIHTPVMRDFEARAIQNINEFVKQIRE